jgi:ATP-dependent helicase/DNAse subunit B
LEEVKEVSAPAFDTSAGVRGGTSVIKLQSLCPFRAFAELRLSARLPEDAAFGFDALDRGKFLHKALQLVWQELKTQQALKAAPELKLWNIVRDAVAAALQQEEDEGFRGETTAVERDRLEHLIFDWLVGVERERLIPFTVENTEDQLEFSLGGLPLRLRIDRIDRLRNGGLVLIDYKSGSQTKTKLQCPRPPEPQLLVYAAAKGSQVEGVLFGQVKARELKLVGFSRSRHFKGGSTTALNNEWDDFIEESRDEVERLAAGFLRGDAVVDPAKTACEYCDLKALCRVQELSAANEESE